MDTDVMEFPLSCSRRHARILRIRRARMRERAACRLRVGHDADLEIGAVHRFKRSARQDSGRDRIPVPPVVVPDGTPGVCIARCAVKRANPGAHR